MGGTIKINGEELEIFTENESSENIALASFSGYLGFTGEIAKQYGGTPGKIVNVVFDVSGGIVTGVFDENLNSQKEYDNIIGIALVAYGGQVLSGSGADPNSSTLNPEEKYKQYLKRLADLGIDGFKVKSEALITKSINLEEK